MRVYLDGSGKPDSTTMTLCSIVATDELWAQFEALWERALDVNSVPNRRFSMTDLIARKKGFEKWDDAKERALFASLFNVLGSLRDTRLAAYSCTVVMTDYHRAKKEIPQLRKPEAICVNYCVGGLKFTAEELGKPGCIELYFDRNEGFLHTVNKVWLPLAKKRIAWGKQIRCIASVDDSCYLIQAADMLAGIVGRYHRGKDRWEGQWQMFSSHLMIQHYVELYNYSLIVDQYKNDKS